MRLKIEFCRVRSDPRPAGDLAAGHFAGHGVLKNCNPLFPVWLIPRYDSIGGRGVMPFQQRPQQRPKGRWGPKGPPGALQIGDYAHEALKHIRQHAHGACECLCPRTPSLYRVAASQKRHPELPPTYRPLISADFLVQMMVAKGYRGIADPHYRRTPCSKWCGGACWGSPT